MTTPEKRDTSEDYGYFTFGILMLLIGLRFFVGEPEMSQERYSPVCVLSSAS